MLMRRSGSGAAAATTRPRPVKTKATAQQSEKVTSRLLGGGGGRDAAKKEKRESRRAHAPTKGRRSFKVESSTCHLGEESLMREQVFPPAKDDGNTSWDIGSLDFNSRCGRSLHLVHEQCLLLHFPFFKTKCWRPKPIRPIAEFHRGPWFHQMVVCRVQI